MSNKVKVVILTALEEERNAVLLFLEDTIKEEKSGRTDYVFYSEKYNYKIVLVCINAIGRMAATDATTQVINDYEPEYIILTGIAGGIEKKEVNRGDLIIASSIIDFALEKETDDGYIPRDLLENIDADLLQQFRNFKDNNENLLVKISNLCCMSEFRPTIYIEKTACTDKVITAEAEIDKLLKRQGDLYCFEMEGFGVTYSAYKHGGRKKSVVFFIKGISDLGVGKNNELDKERWRNYARNIAAFYAVKFINYLQDNNFFPPIEAEHRHKGWWLIKNPELWNDYIEVLYFAKVVHHISQHMGIHIFDVDIDKLDSKELHKMSIMYQSETTKMTQDERKIFSCISTDKNDKMNNALDNIIIEFEKFNDKSTVDTTSIKDHYVNIKSQLTLYYTHHSKIKSDSISTDIDNFIGIMKCIKDDMAIFCLWADILIKLLVEMLLANNSGDKK